MLLLTEGFDLQTTSELNTRWVTGSANGTIAGFSIGAVDADHARVWEGKGVLLEEGDYLRSRTLSSNPGADFTTAQAAAGCSLRASSDLLEARFHWYRNNSLGTGWSIQTMLRLVRTSTDQDFDIEVYTGPNVSPVLQIGKAVAAWPRDGRFHYLEFRSTFVPAGSGGEITVRVDGSQRIHETNVNTSVSFAILGFQGIEFWMPNNGGSSSIEVDDVWVTDTFEADGSASPVNPGFLGPCTCHSTPPLLDGSLSQWTLSGGGPDHYLNLLGDATGAGTALTSTGSGQRETFKFAVPDQSQGFWNALCLNYSLQVATGSRTVTAIARHRDGTIYELGNIGQLGGPVGLTAITQYWVLSELNPRTSRPWSRQDFIDFEFGIQTEDSGQQITLRHFYIEAISRFGPTVPTIPSGDGGENDADASILRHNWADGFELESSYSTSISSGVTDNISDRYVRSHRPNRTATVTWLADNKARANILWDALRRGSGLDQDGYKDGLNVPIYSDFAELEAFDPNMPLQRVYCDTRFKRFFKGGIIAILAKDGNSAEFAVIDEVGDGIIQTVDQLSGSVAAGDTIFPCFRAERAANLPLTQLSGSVWQASLEFSEVASPLTLPRASCQPPSGFQQAQNVPIFDLRHNWIEGADQEFVRDLTGFDGGRGAQTTARGPRYRLRQFYTLALDREGFWQLLSLFDYSYGSAGTFWIPEHNFLPDVAAVLPSEVRFSPQGSYDRFSAELSVILFRLTDGTLDVRFGSPVDNGSYWSFNTANVPFSTTDVVGSHRARLVRFDSPLRERWLSSELVICSCSFLEELESPLISYDWELE